MSEPSATAEPGANLTYMPFDDNEALHARIKLLEDAILAHEWCEIDGHVDAECPWCQAEGRFSFTMPGIYGTHKSDCLWLSISQARK